MGYVYGEEERAIRLANEVERRYEDLVEKTHSTPADQRPSVLSLAWYSDQHWVAGRSDRPRRVDSRRSPRAPQVWS